MASNEASSSGLSFVGNTAKAGRSVIEMLYIARTTLSDHSTLWKRKHSLRVHGFNLISGDTRRTQYEEHNYLLA
jgi:hypothetical protein